MTTTEQADLSADTNTIEISRELSKRERQLVLFLRFVACWTMLAFAASVMPDSWIVGMAEYLSFTPFPHSPLTFYLARHLSLLYGFGGIGLFVICNDYPRYQPLFPLLGLGTIAFGISQLVIDLIASMPWWWTLSESLSTIAGGALIWWMARRANSN